MLFRLIQYACVASLSAGIFVAVLGGCSPDVFIGSRVFSRVVTDTSGYLRGSVLDTPFSEAVLREDSTALLSDSLGQLMQYPLPNQGVLLIEYWRSAKESAVLKSIVVNALLYSETTARELYSELAAYYKEKTGRDPVGAYGHYKWLLLNQQVLQLRLDRSTNSVNICLYRSTEAL